MTLRLRPIQILEAVEDLGRRVRQPKFIQYLTFTAFGADDPAKNQQLVSRMFTALSTIAEPFLSSRPPRTPSTIRTSSTRRWRRPRTGSPGSTRRCRCWTPAAGRCSRTG